MKSVWLWVGLTIVASAMADTYTAKGPFTFDHLKWKHAIPSAQENGHPRVLTFTITFPTSTQNDEESKTKFPVIFFYPGFEMRSTYYTPYVQQMASWGYVVVQYDVPILPILTDKTHVEYFPFVLEWVMGQLQTTAVPKNVDYDAIGVAGHSRGGKLAALIAAEHPFIKGVFLIDPVNGDNRYAKESEDFPSAVEALAGKNRKMAIAGSSVSGPCNPDEFDYRHFWKVAGDGSWLSVVSEAGHCQFMSAPPAQQWIYNKMCKKGKTTCKDVVKRTYPSLVAWLDLTFRTNEAHLETNQMSRIDEFFLWVESKTRSGDLAFYVKGEIEEV